MAEGLMVRRVLNDLPRAASLGLLAGTIKNRRWVERTIREVQPELIITFGIDGIAYNVYDAVLASGYPVLASIGDTWLSQCFENLRRFSPLIGLTNPVHKKPIKRALGLAAGQVARAFGLTTNPTVRRKAPMTFISNYLLEEIKRTGGDGPTTNTVIPLILSPLFFNADGSPIGPAERAQGSSELRVLFLSRMEMLKGPDVAIQAIARAADAGVPIRLTMAGFGTAAMRDELLKLSESLGISDRIEWVSDASNEKLVEIYRDHDVFLFPSRIIEGMGGVNAEAMACGLPVLATTKSGTGHLVRHGLNGFSHEPGDHATLGDQLILLAKDRNLHSRLSAAAMDSILEYHPAKVIDAWERAIPIAIEEDSRILSGRGT